MIDGRYVATLTRTQSSGALYSLVEADGLLIVPEDVRNVPQGTEVEVRLLR
jgi:molybdopterin biosynthesis enzyme